MDINKIRRSIRDFFLANPRFALAFPVLALQPFFWVLVYSLYVNGGQAIAMLAAGFMIVPFASLAAITLMQAVARWFMRD